MRERLRILPLLLAGLWAPLSQSASATEFPLGLRAQPAALSAAVQAPPLRLAGASLGDAGFIAESDGGFLSHLPSHALRVHAEGVSWHGADGHTVRMQFAGAAAGELTGEGAASSLRVSRGDFSGRVQRYERIRARGLYPGVAVDYHLHSGRLQYDLHLSPGVSLEQVELSFVGADTLSLEADGSLRVGHSGRTLLQHAPRCYQEGAQGPEPIAGRFELRANGRVGFVVEGRALHQALVVDPLVEYAQGATPPSGWTGGNLLMSRPHGDGVWLAGTVQGAAPGDEDVFVGRWSADGRSLQQLSYLGGSARERVLGLYVDDAGEVWLSGYTESADFPVRGASLQSTYAGRKDGFLARLDTEGRLRWSSYLGGAGVDVAHAISGTGTQVYVTGQTSSTRLAGRSSEGRSPGADVFVLALESGAWSWLSRFGGAGRDVGHAVSVGSDGRVWLSGESASADLPVSAASSYGGGVSDGFVGVYTAAGERSSLRYVGGSGREWLKGLWVDSAGAWVSGFTESPELVSGGTRDGLLLRLDTHGALSWQRVLGGSGREILHSVWGTASGAWVVGGVHSSDLAVSTDALQATWGGQQDGLVGRYSATGELEYLSYLGGSGNDLVYAVSGSTAEAPVWVAGRTSSGVLPGIPGISGFSASAPGLFVVRYRIGNQAPVFTSVALTETEAGSPYSYTAEATDADEDALSYRLAEGPVGMVLEASSGVVSWREPALGSHPVRLEALDGQGGIGEQTYTLQVRLRNELPTFTSTARNQAAVGLAYRYTARAMDPEGEALSYRLGAAPAGMGMDAVTGVVSWPAPVAGTHSIRLEAVDPRAGVGEQVYTLEVRAQNTAPEFGEEAAPAGVVDAAYRYTVPVTDADGDALVLRLVSGPLGLSVQAGALHWTPAAAGSYSVELEAEDALGATTLGTLRLEVGHAPGQGPPEWGNLATTYTVPLGSRLRLQLPVTDVRGNGLRFYLQPLPLPPGMELGAATGEWTFRPQLQGVYDLILGVSDGRFQAERPVRVLVPPVDPDAPTRFTGRLLDADSLARGIERPIVGARVSLLQVEQSTTTDAQGYFALTEIPVAEEYILDLDPSSAQPAPLGLGYAGFRERITLYAHAVNEEPRPFTLPRLAAVSRTQVNPQLETMVVNPDLGVELRIPAETALAEDGSLYVGELWISEVPPGLAPAALPEELGFGQLVTIQPVGVRFAEPVPITFTNRDGLPAGTEVDIWSIDPERGEFVVVGKGRVSTDEQRIETISGGIRAADWHGPGPPGPDGQPNCEDDSTPEDCPPDENSPDENNCCRNMGSSVNLSNGALGVSFALPAYRSLGASRSLEFVYRSDSAYPRPVVSFRVSLGPSNLRQTAFEYAINWAGRQEDPIFVSIPEERSPRLRQGVVLDASELDSGSYRYSLGMANIWRTFLQNVSRPPGNQPIVGLRELEERISRFSSFRRGRVLVDNARKSAFGSGWRLRDLYELKPQRDPVFGIEGGGPLGGGASIRRDRSAVRGGAVAPSFGGELQQIGTFLVGATLVRPGMRPVHYQRDQGVFLSPGADFAQLSLLEEGRGYLYEEKDGTQRTFDAEGRQLERRDRNGNVTRYSYGAGDLLSSITDPAGQVTKLRYRNDYLWEMEDPAGRVSRFERDGRGRLLAVHYPDGSKERYAYDGRDLMVERWDERGQRTGYGYNRFGQTERATLPDGSERVLRSRSQVGLHEPGSGTLDSPVSGVSQDSPGVVATSEDARGHGEQNKLDAYGSPIWTQDAVGRVSTHARDRDSNAVRTTRPNGSVATRTFDEQGNMLSRTEAFNGATTRYTYDDYSLVTSITNPRGNELAYDRDDKGNLLKITDAAGHETTYTYDTRGLVTEEVTSNGLVRTYTYNAQGLVEQVVETPPPDSPREARTTRVEYHDTGLPSRVILPDGTELTLDYDARNRLRVQRDLLGRSQSYAYDAYGNVVHTQTQGADSTVVRWMRSEYDVRNRLVQEVYPHTEATESILHYGLDAESNMVTMTDPNGGISRASYDSVDRHVSETHRLEGVTEYSYDELDHLVQVQAPNGVVTEYTNDAIGRRIEEASPDRGTIRYRYDLADNMISMREARGVTATYSYDTLERVSEVRYPNRQAGKDETVRYTYDTCSLGKGRLCTMQDESGTSSYRYDAWGNLVEMRHAELGVEYVSGYTYDAGNRVIAQTLPSGRVVEYSRDALRRVTAVRTTVNGVQQSIVSNLRYRADDLMESCKYGNGLEDRRSYDLQGRLTHQELRTGAGLSVYRRAYGYDANSNITTLSMDGLSHHYAYDALDRLVEDGGVDPNVQYSYDLNDNRQRRDLVDESFQAGYTYTEESNRLDLIEDIERTDATVTPSGRRLRMDYNDAGRLWRLYEDGELVAEYIYNAAGQRTRKVLHEGETSQARVFHYGMEGQLQAETDGTGRLLREYIWVNGQVVAQIDAQAGPGDQVHETLVYLYSDHLMTPRVGTDHTGRIVWRWDGDAFGATAAEEDPDADGRATQVALRFPGQYRDVESGWYYNYYREYDPRTGRYIQSDPVDILRDYSDPQLQLALSMGVIEETRFVGEMLSHLYGYVGQNPLAWYDPYGLEEHTSGSRNSTRNKHERGKASKNRSRGGERGDKNRGHPRKRPLNYSGKWPPPLPRLPLIILIPYILLDPCLSNPLLCEIGTEPPSC